MKRIELLAPAGDLTKLKTAIEYGADAVYLAGDSFGLRKASKNFNEAELKEAVIYAHERGKKIYVTMNIIPHNRDMVDLENYVQYLEDINVDAVIAADIGMISAIRRASSSIDIHLSTQANTTNYEAVNFWYDFGIKRVVLARELSIEEMVEIRANIPHEMELETFAHGAMCISYSGRCLLSNYMVGRDANLGDCAHACRWNYHLVEEKRPGEYFPVMQDEEGTYIMNSKDLCLIKYIDRLINSGVNSLKIEGRVKSQYYVATVIRSYRLAIDAYYEGRFSEELGEELTAEIRKASHRDFTTGFALGKTDENSQVYGTSSYIRGYDFIGLITNYDDLTKIATIEQRNRFGNGDVVEIFGPRYEYYEYEVQGLTDERGNPIEVAPHAQQIVKLKIDLPIGPWFMMRRKI